MLTLHCRYVTVHPRRIETINKYNYATYLETSLTEGADADTAESLERGGYITSNCTSGWHSAYGI